MSVYLISLTCCNSKRKKAESAKRKILLVYFVTNNCEESLQFLMHVTLTTLLENCENYALSS